jgi:hypothetical protein
MRWRSEYSWVIFFLTTGAIAVVAGRNWFQRVPIFLIETVPITIWAVRRTRAGGKFR